MLSRVISVFEQASLASHRLCAFAWNESKWFHDPRDSSRLIQYMNVPTKVKITNVFRITLGSTHYANLSARAAATARVRLFTPSLR